MDQQLTGVEPLAASTALVISLEAARAPLDALASFIDLPHPCCLHSNAPHHPLSRFSYLAADPLDVISVQASDWSTARERLRASFQGGGCVAPELPPFQGGWIGWLSYELGTAFDRVSRHLAEPLPTPDVALGWYDWVIAWDHLEQAAWLISSGSDATGECDARRARQRAEAVLARWRTTAPHRARPAARRTDPRSDFTVRAYERAVSRAIEHVLDGDIFQVNLAQRFSGEYRGDPWALYAAVAARTAAPMAAFVQHDGISVISASPERFLRYDPRTRRVETRPIKGTRPRGADAARDTQYASDLESSEKDRAENVMIVDLLRNDLSRVCEPGSVRATEVCALESHPTVHHLVSTVVGELRSGYDAVDLLAATFPGGSVTGAPKLRAMEIISSLEPVSRGVYSGSIAWIGRDGAMDSNIAIRSIVLADGLATLHAGGAITAQSVPAAEREESMDKARALIAAVTAA